MLPPKFIPGDIVKLKSGRTIMFVVGYEQESIHIALSHITSNAGLVLCKWLINGQWDHGVFHEKLLELVSRISNAAHIYN